MTPILQTEASECGLACLAMVASHYGYETDIANLRQKFIISIKGTTLAQVISHAAKLDLSSRPLRLEVDEVENLRLPCILHWNLNHFVVLKKLEKNWRGELQFILLDPAHGERKLGLNEFSASFTGVALEILPTPIFRPKLEKRKIKLTDLIGTVHGIRSTVVKLLMLAFALEVFAITAPLFNQFVIDEVIVSADKELLLVLLIGFALLTLVQNAIGLARSWFLMRWSQDLSLQWNMRVFHHLLRLPISFFEKRHVGDIVSKFSSINAIQGTITNLLIETLLDGVLTILALIMMLMYSVKLGLVAVTAVLLYGLLRWAFYKPSLEAARGRIIFASRENSHFLETLRAVTPIKLFGKESERLARWQNLKVAVQNRDVETQKIDIYFRIGNSLIFSIENLAVLYIGATQVIHNNLTVGMLMAFMSYSNTFTSRIANLIDVFISLRMLGMHNERLSDIVLNRPEELDYREFDLNQVSTEISLNNVSYRYADGEPWVLENVNLSIPAGQSIALTGPSGCGKTTLCKILLGLISPTRGEILIGGKPIHQIGLQNYRRLVGTVMQDDVLLAGSILDNIAFFDSQVELARVEHCAQLAAVHEDIVKMPMGYQTLVGDMGSSLSGGQKQRVLLARALYKQPQILALDEATSHLDIANEHKVNQALSQLSLTRIMVAHRPETINAAERVVALEQGKVVEIRSEPLSHTVQIIKTA